MMCLPQQKMNNKPNFIAKSRARRYAMQALYSWSISDNPLRDIEDYMITEHIDQDFDIDYFRVLLHDIPAKLSDLENMFIPYLINRDINDLDPIERTILRIATFELHERLEIPYRVVINEALEMAKTFGAKDSFKFINSVMDKLAQRLRQGER